MRLRECFHRLRVDGRSKRIKKFAFTIVCVYNRLRVDGALGCLGDLNVMFILHIIHRNRLYIIFESETC